MPSDKAYSTEQRLNALVNSLGPQFLASALPINTTGGVTIFTFPVVAGTYEIDGWLNLANSTAADPAQFSFSAPSTTTPTLVEYANLSGTNPGAWTHLAATTLTTAFNNQGVAGTQMLLVKATAAFTAAGNLVFSAAEDVGGNPVNISAGSRMNCYRIA